MPSWSQKSEAKTFPADFCTRNFLGWSGVRRYAATPLIVALFPGHSDITRFHPWSPITTGNHLDCTEKIPKVAQRTGTVGVFDPRSGISGPNSWRASACPNLHEWLNQPAHELPSCSARSSKISSWIWSIISGVVIVLGRPGRGTSQVKKSPRLNWATQFLMAYDGACSPNVSVIMVWISFGALPCRKKNLMTARVSMLKSRTSSYMLPFILYNKKRLAIWHMNRPIFPTTLLIPSDIGK